MKRGMRTLLLVLASVVVFVGAYLASSILLPDPPMALDEGDQGGTLTLPEATAPGEGVGPSEGMSFRVFDPQTNLPVAQVRIGTYRRTGERTVELKDVTVSVAVQGGAAAVLTSERGIMRVEPPVSGGDSQIDADALAAADQVRLSDVTIRWYDDAANLARGRGATTTATLDNVLLDYTRMTLATADTTINGRTVLSDDVPVRVRGSDYDFDGYGLLIAWDANAKRPELVRVARGERLVVKKAPALTDTATARGPGDGIFLAALDDAVVAEAVANASAAPATPFTPYRVTLTNDLTVEQNGLMLLEADKASAIVALESESVSNLRAAPAEQIEPEQPKPDQPRKTPTTQPATPTFEPITVRWSGPLTMEPAAADAPELVDADDVRLQAIGTPLLARFEGGEVHGKTVDYHRAGDRLEVHAASGEDVRLTDTEGNRVVAPSLVAAPEAGTATAVGAGRAELAATADAGPTTLVWQRLCNFAFEQTPADGEGGDESFALREVDAQGAVIVQSDDLNLSAETLGLGFVTTIGPDGKETPQLRSVTASGSVDCTLSGSEIASFTAGRMWLDLPKGPDGPVDAWADGGVRTSRDNRTLAGQSLTAELRPDETGELALDRLEVVGDVVAQDADGRTLTGHIATIDGPDRPLVVVGGDNRLARVNITNEEAVATVAAESVVLDPTDESFAVPVAGEMFVEQIDESGERKSRTVKWSGGLAATSERVDVTGGVELRGDPDEAATFLLTSDAATLLLAADDRVATDDSEATTAGLAGDVEQVEVRGNVRLTAEERDAAGQLLRSIDLRAPIATGRPQEESFSVPAAGRFLYRDLRAAEEETDEDTFGGFRGLAAFGWQGRLDYRPLAEELTLTGGATASLEPDDAPPFQVTADAFIVQVTRETPEAPPQLNGAVATGNVEFTSPGHQSFTAERLVYDEATGTLTATGAGGSVRLFDKNGRPTGQFAELVYNVRTGQIDHVSGLRGG